MGLGSTFAPRAGALAIVATLVAASSGAARADTSEGNTAAAEALFQQGRKLADSGKFADACPKFLASQKLAPAVGTLLNLADCYQHAGQTASAWARFHEAIAAAQRAGRADREKVARDRAAALEPKLSKLVVAWQETGIEVKRDGTVVDPAALGVPVPVDPGSHTIEASAPGKKAWSVTVDVGEKAQTVKVDVPALEDGPKPVNEPTKVERTSAADDNPGGTQRTIGIVVLAAGVVGAGAGTFFGLRTSSTWSDAKRHCQGTACDPQGVSLATDAKNSGNLSTALFIAGGALIATGAVLYLTAPKKAAVGFSPAVGIGQIGLTASGAF